MSLPYDFFSNNRLRLLEKLGGGLVVVSGNDEMQASNDMAFPFRQDANFWWLTGIEEPGWILVIEGKHGKSTLVCPTLSNTKQLFDGGLTVAGAKTISDVDEIIDGDTWRERLKILSKRYRRVHTLDEDPRKKDYEFCMNPGPLHLKKQLQTAFEHFDDCRKELAELRAIKTNDELAAIRRAVDLTVEAFDHARMKLAYARYEYALEAEFDYFFRSHNATHAYDPIVANGANACTLHYTSNGGPMQSGELTVLDIGARVDGYAADVTRTWGVGEIDARRRDVHRAVAEAQATIVKLIHPGLTVEEYILGVDEIMQNALRQLGLMADGTDLYRRYFPHAISHGLGVDVHDSLGGAHALAPGMVLTVEPGIYIPEEGIGVRIEDDILVTSDGAENLSEQLSTGY